MRSKTIAIIFAWLLWPILDFFLGRPGRGVVQLITLGGLGIWALMDTIRLTIMSQADFDSQFSDQ